MLKAKRIYILKDRTSIEFFALFVDRTDIKNVVKDDVGRDGGHGGRKQGGK